MTGTYLDNIYKGFSERTAYSRRIVFGLHQTNVLKAAVWWVQDLQRIIREPTLDFIEETSIFKESIDAESVWADIQNHNSDESESLSKAVDPGKLKNKK